MEDLTIAEELLKANNRAKLNRARGRMMLHISEKQTGLTAENQRIVETRCLAAFKANVRRLPGGETRDLDALVRIP